MRVAPSTGDRHKGPTTHTRGDAVPEDFKAAFAAYHAHDDVLYADAVDLLRAHVALFPSCATRYPVT